MPHQVNVVSVARLNEDFRRVLFTGERSQLVVMTIPPGGEVGDERHDHVEQTLFCLSGSGTAILDGARSPFVPATPWSSRLARSTTSSTRVPSRCGSTRSTRPRTTSTGGSTAPKADADADQADEEFGHGVGG